MPELPIITDRDHLDGVCRLGQGAATCRWAVATPLGIACAKGDPNIGARIALRIAADDFVARGDNCDGFAAVVARAATAQRRNGEQQTPLRRRTRQ